MDSVSLHRAFRPSHCNIHACRRAVAHFQHGIRFANLGCIPKKIFNLPRAGFVLNLLHNYPGWDVCASLFDPIQSQVKQPHVFAGSPKFEGGLEYSATNGV